MSTSLLTPERVAEHLRCSPRTVYRLIASGRLAVVHVGERRAVRVRISELNRYIKAVRPDLEKVSA